MLLEDEIDRVWWVVCFDELVKDGGAQMEGWVGEDFVGFFGQNYIEKILLEDGDVVDMAFYEVGAELGGGSGVRFDGDDMLDATREGAGDNPRAGADFDDLVAFFEVGVAD